MECQQWSEHRGEVLRAGGGPQEEGAVAAEWVKAVFGAELPGRLAALKWAAAIDKEAKAKWRAKGFHAL